MRLCACTLLGILPSSRCIPGLALPQGSAVRAAAAGRQREDVFLAAVGSHQRHTRDTCQLCRLLSRQRIAEAARGLRNRSQKGEAGESQASGNCSQPAPRVAARRKVGATPVGDDSQGAARGCSTEGSRVGCACTAAQPGPRPRASPCWAEPACINKCRQQVAYTAGCCAEHTRRSRQASPQTVGCPAAC